jgi:hypothetical protein
MQASLTAIGRQLHDDYQPTLAKPLPTELKDLVARLIALEINKRGTSRRAIAVLQARNLPIRRTINDMEPSSCAAPLHYCPDRLPTSL